MIKTFKDFDKELKGQKIYESIDDEKEIFTSKDLEGPKLVSDNIGFIKITKIILKKLNNCGIGKFCVHPTIVNIDDVDGIYFYNYDDPSINIVICKNVHGKQAYFFKEFNFDGKNVASLVLTTRTLGFTDIINRLINYITSNNTIEEGFIFESWQEGNTTIQYTDVDVQKVSSLDPVIRQKIVDYITSNKNPNLNNVKKEIWNDKNNGVQDAVDICNALHKNFSKINISTGVAKKMSDNSDYFNKTILMFIYAITGATAHQTELDAILNGCKTGKNNNGGNNGGANLKGDPDDIQIQQGTGAKIVTYQRTPELQAKIDASAKKYKERIEDINDYSEMLCEYVKNNGELSDDDASIFTRGLFITGPGGTGKTKHILDMLEKKDMKKNVDYFELGSGSTSASNLFRLLYDFNGKLLILDDCAELFVGKYNRSLWLKALSPDPRENFLSIGSSYTAGSNYYNPNQKGKNGQPLTRQEKYFLEIGKSSLAEKTKFEKQMELNLWGKYDKKTLGPKELKETEIEINQEIADAWREHEENKEPKIPTTFKYNGAVIVVSNDSQANLIQQVGGWNKWEALKQRFTCIELNPMPQAIWATIKEKILEQRDNNIDDDLCIIPKLYVDDFIAEVDSIIDFEMYNHISWRMVTVTMSKAFRGNKGLKRWKSMLRDKMRKTEISED